MKLKKFLKPFSRGLNLVIVNIDNPKNNSYNKYFPTIHRHIDSFGFAQSVRGEVSSWQFIDSCEVVHVEEVEWVKQDSELSPTKYLAVYYRIQK